MKQKIVVYLPKRFLTNRRSGESFEMTIEVPDELNAEQQEMITKGIEIKMDVLVENSKQQRNALEGAKLVWALHIEKLKNSDWVELIEKLAAQILKKKVGV